MFNAYLPQWHQIEVAYLADRNAYVITARRIRTIGTVTCYVPEDRREKIEHDETLEGILFARDVAVAWPTRECWR